MKRRLTALVLILVMFAGCAQAAEFAEESFGIRLDLSDSVTVDNGYQRLSKENGLGIVDFFCEDAAVAELVVLDDVLAPQLYDFAEAIIEVPEALHNNGLTYILLTTNEEIDEEMSAAIKDVRTALDEAEFFPSVPYELEGSSLRFSTVDLNGNEVTESVFAGKKVTMLNVWATTCNPCLNEMPELSKLQNELDDNAQILFLCSNLTDLSDSAAKEVAEAVSAKAGIAPESILLAVPGAFSEMLSTVMAVPTTFFIDENGRVLEQKVVGAYVDEYRRILNEQLSD